MSIYDKTTDLDAIMAEVPQVPNYRELPFSPIPDEKIAARLQHLDDEARQRLADAKATSRELTDLEMWAIGFAGEFRSLFEELRGDSDLPLPTFPPD